MGFFATMSANFGQVRPIFKPVLWKLTPELAPNALRRINAFLFSSDVHNYMNIKVQRPKFNQNNFSTSRHKENQNVVPPKKKKKKKKKKGGPQKKKKKKKKKS